MFSNYFANLLSLPTPARLNKLFPKAFFTRHGFPLSTAEKLLLNTPFVPLESEWSGSLKPTAGNVPAYPNRPPGLTRFGPSAGEMKYLEIQYFRLHLREEDYPRHAEVLAGLYHRYLPYPLLLILHGEISYHLSAATKHIPDAAGTACTQPRYFRSPEVSLVAPTKPQLAFQRELAFPRLATQNLKTTYDSYLTAITRLAWSDTTGSTPEVAEPEARYGQLEEIRKLERHRKALTAQLRKSRRMTERVELQTELSQLLNELKNLKA